MIVREIWGKDDLNNRKVLNQLDQKGHYEIPLRTGRNHGIRILLAMQNSRFWYRGRHRFILTALKDRRSSRGKIYKYERGEVSVGFKAVQARISRSE